jgi:hypothetical protein
MGVFLPVAVIPPHPRNVRLIDVLEGADTDILWYLCGLGGGGSTR